VISGLDQIQESPCVFHCPDASGGDEAAGDDGAMSDARPNADSSSSQGGATTDAASHDGSHGMDATADGFARGDSGAPDGSAHPVDAGADGHGGEPGEGDARADARDGENNGNDAQADVHAPGDGEGADASCGPLDTVTHCGACGATCASSSSPTAGISMASCMEGSCQYQCKPTYLDCNASVAPDTDGCECPTNGSISAKCCGSACPKMHTTGFATGPSGQDQTFYDCEPKLDEQSAMDACSAYSGRGAYCAQGTCPGSADLLICNFNAPINQDHVCWDYQGSYAGWAVDSTLGPTCPLSTVGGTGQVQFR
jgi:hypothetical protein